MKTALVTAACLGLSLSTASACESMRSAQAKVDKTVVASVATEDQPLMSTTADTAQTRVQVVPGSARKDTAK